MTFYVKKNNSQSVTSGNITAIATTLDVLSGEGANFPSSFPFLITVWDSVNHPNPTDDTDLEIMEVSGRSTDTLTVVRGKESTIGFAHLDGAKVGMLITAGIFDDSTYGLEANITGDMLVATYDPTAVSGDVFDMGNMVEAANAKVLTSAERTILGNTSGTNAGDQNAAGVSIADAGALITATDVEGALAENRTAINLNTSKATNVSTVLSEGTRTATTYGITSDGGADDLVLPEADTTNAGILGADKWDEIVANTSKVTNVSTNLSEGTSTETTVDVDSSDGTNATLLAASTIRAGLLTKAKFDEIVANNAKNTYPSGDSTKVGYISITQAVDLDAVETHTVSTSNPHSVTKTQVSLGNVEDLKVNLIATGEPTVNDDSGGGYSIGSRWFDGTNDKEYVCLDATLTAAVWIETTVNGGVSSHALGGAEHTADTLNNLNSKVSDATLIDTGDSRLSDSRTPTPHATTHVTGGSDVITNAIAAGNAGLMTGTDKAKLNGIETSAKDDQTASEVPIVDAGAIITATEVEGALQENRTAINLNTSKDTNVSTDLSEGTSTETTVDVNSSDGTNATLVSASTSRAGLLTKSKFDEIVVNNAKATNVVYPAETATTVGALIGGAGDATPNDTDFVATSLTAGGILKKITWTNSKAFLKTYFDTLYATIANPTFTGEIGIGAVNVSETELGILEGATLSTTELNYVDGVTSAIQTQLNAKVRTVSLWLAAAASDLPQSDFTLTGTVTMTNASTAVTGSGTAFDTELKVGDYIKLDADGSTYWAKISAIATATALTIDAIYGGTGGSSAGSGSGRPSGYSYISGTGESLGYGILEFDDTGLERAGWRIPLPDVATTMTLKIYWKQASAGTGNVVFKLGIKGVGEGENITTLVMPTLSDTITDAAQNNITYLTIAIDASVASNASDDEMGIFLLEVDAPNASHTLVGDVHVFGIYVEYTRV